MTAITNLLEKATARYAAAVSEVLPYLERRGIDPQVAADARLGVVLDPEPGHEDYYGRLSIPYITRSGVVSLKFRCTEDHDCKENGHPKYLCLSGGEGKPHLYNVNSFFARSQIVGITEGEFDALVLSHYAGLPTVGCPGVSTWQSHFPRCFQGYGLVIVATDGDKAGREFGRMIQKQVPNTRVISMPDDEDVSSFYIKYGAEALRQRLGLYEFQESSQAG
jgi:DNA primase